MVLQHIPSSPKSALPDLFASRCELQVKEAEDKENILPGYIYFAPPNYHLLIEREKHFSLSVEEAVNYSRPSIDLLFESAAVAYRNRLGGIILTGANSDGAVGLRAVAKYNGLTIVENPASSYEPFMPRAALSIVQPDYVLGVEEIAACLASGSMAEVE